MQLSAREPGLWPMLYAFFDDRGALRHDAFEAQVSAAARAGCAGVAVLGLGTEVGKLTPEERLATLDAVHGAAAGRLPILVTVYGDTPSEQIAFARTALERGAAFLVLQPPKIPPGEGAEDEAALVAFFATVMDAVARETPDCPVGIQNAPQFIGHGLGPDAIMRLRERCTNFRVAKAEASAVDLAALGARLGRGVALFNGRCGLELTDNLRAGAAGLVPGIETADVQAAAVAAFARGEEDEAERLYARVLPAITFVMQGIPHFLTYGKAIAARRLGIEGGGHRKPRLAPTPFGLASAHRFADALGPLDH